MTAAEEAQFIALWQAGAEIAEIAQRLGIPKGTVQSRAHGLQQHGLIAPEPRGGGYHSLCAKTWQDGSPTPGQRPGPSIDANAAVIMKL